MQRVPIALAVITLAVAAPSLAPAGSRQSGPTPIELAVTVDDLPRFDQNPAVPVSRIHRLFLNAFAKYDVPEVYGFVNGLKLKQHPEDREALHDWLRAGHSLGNHTYSHRTATDATDFLADVAANERVLSQLAAEVGQPPGRWKVFRYPSLIEGSDPAVRYRIRAMLIERGYRIAPVTVDFFDWAFDEAYGRCISRGQAAMVSSLKRLFIQEALAALSWSDEVGQRLAGHRIPQVLLLHDAELDATLAQDLFGAFRKRGVRFVTLDRALREPLLSASHGGSVINGDLLSQLMVGRQPPISQRP